MAEIRASVPTQNSDADFTSNHVWVETSDGISFKVRLAGPAPRAAAYGVDLVARIAILLVVALVGRAFPQLAASGWTTGMFLVVAFLLEWGYGAFFETWWRGQTPGKRVFGLRVVTVRCEPVGTFDAVTRNILRAADFTPFLYGAGLMSCLSTARMQRLGDLVAGTMVVHERSVTSSDGLSGLAAYDPLPTDSSPHGYQPSEPTLQAIEALFRRRLSLSPSRVDEIASSLAESLAAQLGEPETSQLASDRPAELLFRLLRRHRLGPASEAI